MFFKLTKDTATPALQQMIRQVQGPARIELLRTLGTTFKSITEGTFNSVGAQFRPKPWPAKVDGSPSILQSRHPTLSKSFHLEVTANYAKLSNPMPYAAIHQFGGQTAAHKIVPRRRQALAFGGVVVRSVNHPGSQIPARPFFPVDAQGRLTPAAEVLLRGAGQRALDRLLGTQT